MITDDIYYDARVELTNTGNLITVVPPMSSRKVISCGMTMNQAMHYYRYTTYQAMMRASSGVLSRSHQ